MNISVKFAVFDVFSFVRLFFFFLLSFLSNHFVSSRFERCIVITKLMQESNVLK